MTMQRWVCMNCGWMWDEAVGDPDSGIPPGTRFEDLPADWKCPDCGAARADFELMEV